MLLICLLLILSLQLAGGSGLPIKDGGAIVQTQYGAVQGISVEEGDIFLGLPFAEPPVGDLRWQPPQPFSSQWSPSVRDGSVPGQACPQHGCQTEGHDPQHLCPRDGKQSEDCLYLNIFVPHASHHDTEKLPVLFFIHGGDYGSSSGSALAYDGRFLAEKSNTVVVTTNYRLGALGFLVAGQGKDAATGNYGLLDQIEALKWVQANIGNFRGDKNRVTLVGQGAGADSIGIHLTSNKSAGLFDKAIMLSLPFTIPHKSKVEALLLGDYFAEQLNCSHGDMRCLRSKSVNDVVAVQQKADRYITNPFKLLELFTNWSPTIDSDILSAEVLDSFSRGLFQRKPFIIGTTSEEAVLFVHASFNKKMSKLEFEEFILAFMHEKAVAVYKEYKSPPSSDYRPYLAEMLTDLVFTCPTRNVIRSAVAAGDTNVWLYVFDQVWSMKHAWDLNPYCNGHVCNGEDLAFLFQAAPLVNITLTFDEQNMADDMAVYYGNFAHTGNPNTPGLHSRFTHAKKSGGLLWPRYNQHGHYTSLNITTPQNVLIQDYRKEKCDFWDKMKKYTGMKSG
ncbi:cAMP-regulated D2 protein-like [Branchiostoma lanceolatum]|uniref:cAMP-regulated D2 protein-like n=1 Tax=Branchiostoma lanceolatum TaxID=7740 RepID=UPI003453C520